MLLFKNNISFKMTYISLVPLTTGWYFFDGTKLDDANHSEITIGVGQNVVVKQTLSRDCKLYVWCVHHLAFS